MKINWGIKPKTRLNKRTRLKFIIVGLTEGINLEKIASRCGVSRRTIYKDRASVDSQLLAQRLIDLQLLYIAKLAQTLDPIAQNRAMNYRDKLIQKLVPKKIISEAKGKIEVGVKVPEFTEEDIARYTDVFLKLSREHKK